MELRITMGIVVFGDIRQCDVCLFDGVKKLRMETHQLGDYEDRNTIKLCSKIKEDFRKRMEVIYDCDIPT